MVVVVVVVVVKGVGIAIISILKMTKLKTRATCLKHTSSK